MINDSLRRAIEQSRRLQEEKRKMGTELGELRGEKRIDKSHIKGTNERVTVPGKIAIIYSQDRDAQEYLNYIEYLQAEGKLAEVEMLDVEDLQGVSGLKAIRVEVRYQEKIAKKAKTKG